MSKTTVIPSSGVSGLGGWVGVVGFVRMWRLEFVQGLTDWASFVFEGWGKGELIRLEKVRQDE